MKRVLSMFLAMVMVLSLVPAVGASAGVGSDGGIILANGTTANPGIDIKTEEVTSAPYYPGSIIRHKITITFTQQIELKEDSSIKIHNYNTSYDKDASGENESDLHKNYGNQVQLANHDSRNTNNEQFRIYAYKTTNPNITINGALKANEIKFDVSSNVVQANDSIILWMQFPVTKHSNDVKTLDNFIDISFEAKKDETVKYQLGKEYGKDITFDGETTDPTPSNTFPLEIINQIEGETSSAIEFTYTITSSDTSFTDTVSGVRFTNGQSAEIKLGDGDSKTLYLPLTANYVVEQTENASYSTTSTHSCIEIKNIGKTPTFFGAGDSNNGQATKEDYTWKVKESSKDNLHTITFTNKLSGSPGPMPPEPATGTTYHLNLPEDVRTDGVDDIENYKTGSKFKDFTHQSESGTVLDLHEIPSFTNGSITITGDTSDLDPNDDFVSYYQGYLGSESGDGRYYFVGWSKTPDATFDAAGGVNYRDIDYPVVEITGSGTKTYGERNIYSHEKGSHLKGKALFSYDAPQGDLYAVWTQISNAGLMGYAMTLSGEISQARRRKTARRAGKPKMARSWATAARAPARTGTNTSCWTEATTRGTPSR